MTSVSAIIIEDEEQAADYLRSMIERNYPTLRLIGLAASVQEGLRLIESSDPELVFMDIELEDGLSFEILDRLKEQKFEVVFVTGYAGYLDKALEHFAFSYITKPYADEKLRMVMDRYLNVRKRLYSLQKYEALSAFLKDDDSWFLLHIGNEHIRVRVADILRCESDGNYTKFYMINGSIHLASNILKYYQELFTPKGFIRTNRSTIINAACIQSIYKRESIVLTNGDRVTISTRYREGVQALISSLS